MEISLGLLNSLQGKNIFFPRSNDTFPNPPWEEANRRIAILRLSTEVDVAESASHQFLYALFRPLLPNAFIDMFFLPPKSDQTILEEHRISWPLGIRSLRSLEDFDVILISISYVLELCNLPLILERSGLRRHTQDRPIQSPLIIAGGSSILLSQGIVPYVDALFFGEAEAAATELAQCMAKDHRLYASRLSFLQAEAENVPGLWFSGQENFQSARLAQGIYGNPHGPWPILNSSSADTVRLSISLGCPFRCSFCFEGYERKPYRDKDLDALVQHARWLRRQTGAKSFDAISFNFNTHKAIIPLIEKLSAMYPHVHVMSQRLDILERNPALLEAELLIGKRSFTLGIEGISERLRSYYQKDIDTNSIDSLLHRLLIKGIRDIKLFFIISGLENDSDIESFKQFCMRTAQTIKNFGTCRMLFSFGILQSMPHTPLSFSNFEPDLSTILKLCTNLEHMIKSAGFEFRLAFSEQDHRVAKVLMRADQNNAYLALEALFAGGLYFGKQLSPGSWKALQKVSSSLHFIPEKPCFWQVKGQEYYAVLKNNYAKLALVLDNSAPNLKVEPFSEFAKPHVINNELTKIQEDSNHKKHAELCRLYFDIPFEYCNANPEWLSTWAYRQLAMLIEASSHPELDVVSDVLDCQEDLHCSKERLTNMGPWFGQGRFLFRLRPGKLTHLKKSPQLNFAQAGELKTVSIAYRLQASLSSIDGVMQGILKAEHCPFTLIKSKEIWDYQIAQKAINKAPVQFAQLQPCANSKVEIKMVVKGRFNIRTLSQKLQSLNKQSLVAVHITDFKLGD